MERQFTATVYILNAERTHVLLIYHAKLQKWLPPGGHVESNEMPHEAAIREALEETGVAVQLLQEEHVWIERWNARSFPRPFMCLLEEIPAYKDTSPHQHMDMVYVGEPRPIQSSCSPIEPGEKRWFSLEEIDQLQPDIDIFVETVQVLHYLFENRVCLKKKKWSLPCQAESTLPSALP